MLQGQEKFKDLHMAHIEWTPELNLGIAEIDDQHRRIVDYLNELYQAQLRQDRNMLKEIIDDVMDYTLSHLGFEEVMMRDAGYEFFNAHKWVHDAFVDRVSGLHKRFDEGEDVAAELHALLARWLVNHILKQDKHYVDVVKAHASQNALHTQSKRMNWLSQFFGGK